MTFRSATTGEVADLLLTTLRLRGDCDVAGLRRRWADLDPAGLAALAEYEGSVLWLHRRLRELGLVDVVPATLSQWLSTRARRLAARNLLVDAQRDDLVAILNDLRVPHVLLKGVARRLVADRYPYADARATSDVDVLVPEQLALSSWEQLLKAGFTATSGRTASYDGHFHLPPLINGRAVNVEIHTSTSSCLPAAIAWRRFDRSAQVAACQGGPTRVPAATELLWHAITHAPLPDPLAFRLRFLQDAEVGWAAGAEIDWSEIASRFGSAELPDRALARRWLGTATQLSGVPDTETYLGSLPALDLSQALSWRLTVFRLLGARDVRATRSIWGRHPVSRARRLLIDEATRAAAELPPLPPLNTTSLHRAGRRVVAGVGRLCYHGWRMFRAA
ncbi:MAG: nucleotidyltransferase family protein [Chloroflexi bacterium]|nr:MAG: nucleotidyltransferase family protein [Chloroflexota bacterium]